MSQPTQLSLMVLFAIYAEDLSFLMQDCNKDFLWFLRAVIHKNQLGVLDDSHKIGDDDGVPTSAKGFEPEDKKWYQWVQSHLKKVVAGKVSGGKGFPLIYVVRVDEGDAEPLKAFLKPLERARLLCGGGKVEVLEIQLPEQDVGADSAAADSAAPAATSDEEVPHAQDAADTWAWKTLLPAVVEQMKLREPEWTASEFYDLSITPEGFRVLPKINDSVYIWKVAVALLARTERRPPRSRTP